MAEGFSDLPPDSGGKYAHPEADIAGPARLRCTYVSIAIFGRSQLAGITTDSRAIYRGANKKEAGQPERNEHVYHFLLKAINIEVTQSPRLVVHSEACLAIA